MYIIIILFYLFISKNYTVFVIKTSLSSEAICATKAIIYLKMIKSTTIFTYIHMTLCICKCLEIISLTIYKK